MIIIDINSDFMKLKQTYLLASILIVISMNVVAQTPIGFITDIEGTPLNGITSFFNQNYSNKLIISNSLYGYNWGKIYLKDGTVQDGLLKVNKVSVSFKPNTLEYTEAKTYKVKNIEKVVVGTDLFLKAKNIQVRNKIVKEALVKYLFAFDGIEYGEYYHTKSNNNIYEIYWREIGSEQWNRLDYENKLLLDHTFGYDSLSASAVKSFNVSSKQKEFQRGIITFKTNETIPVYFRSQGKKIFYKESITNIIEEELEPTSLKYLTTEKDSIIIIDSYSYIVESVKYNKKGKFYARFLMSNDTLTFVQTLGNSPQTLQSSKGENEWMKITEYNADYLENNPQKTYSRKKNIDYTLLHETNSIKELLNYILIRRFKSLYLSQEKTFYNKSWVSLTKEETNYYSKVTAFNDTFYEMSYFIEDNLIAKINYKHDIKNAFDKTGDYSLYQNGKLSCNSKYDLQEEKYFIDIFYPNSDQLFYSYSFEKNTDTKPVYHYTQMYRENGEEVSLEGEVEFFDAIQEKTLYNVYEENKLITSYFKEGESKYYYITDTTAKIDLLKTNLAFMDEFDASKVQTSFQENYIGTTFLVADVDKKGEISRISIEGSLHSDFDQEIKRVMKVLFQKGNLKIKASRKINVFDIDENASLRCVIPLSFITQPYNLSPYNNYLRHQMFYDDFMRKLHNDPHIHSNPHDLEALQKFYNDLYRTNRTQ
ncbi:hypothetical protein [Flammeovirga sp. EKP202]|uniref:hypothetical protein n=1 Tax=Flammeovirga sp. EKP202 TaxID=2770592 RepID=UPI00165F4A85|nr:hypothetical protein [Flammeovirga sp. EKP202]MBD0401824.1 hypothetical protein [Flammeovirga sp. EKP202]